MTILSWLEINYLHLVVNFCLTFTSICNNWFFISYYYFFINLSKELNLIDLDLIRKMFALSFIAVFQYSYIVC
jgi:hypothetical protein